MIISFIIGLVLGLAVGILVMRKHKSKADALEAKGRTILDVLKGR